MNTIASIETAGISTGFILVIAGLYKLFKNSNFSYNSNCSNRVLAQVDDIESRIKQEIKQEIQNEIRNASPQLNSAVAPTIQKLNEDI